jgi:membrane-associated phospholipid phosphatase
VRRQTTRTLILCSIALVAAVALDGLAYDHVVLREVYDEDWGRLLRVMGFLPTWAAAALALWLQERGSTTDALARRRALLLLGSPVVAGIAAEVLKLLLRRERPAVLSGDYSWRPFSERPFSTSGLALPSSHTMVAFGAAWMLCRLYPRARWVWMTLAVGCGLTRVLAQAHFVSDVVVAALASLATTTLLWRRFGGVSRISDELRTTQPGIAFKRSKLP